MPMGLTAGLLPWLALGRTPTPCCCCCCDCCWESDSGMEPSRGAVAAVAVAGVGGMDAQRFRRWWWGVVEEGGAWGVPCCWAVVAVGGAVLGVAGTGGWGVGRSGVVWMVSEELDCSAATHNHALMCTRACTKAGAAEGVEERVCEGTLRAGQRRCSQTDALTRQGHS